VSAEHEIEAAIEAILFASPEPVPRERLLAIFSAEERAAAEGALQRVAERFEPGDAARGIMLEEVAGGLRLVTRPELHGLLRRYFAHHTTPRLSMAAIETLAIVAYRQPITAPEIQELRGVSSVGVLKTLLERRLVRVAGRKPVVGKPFLYATTKDFLLQFGLLELADLPPLAELEEALGVEAGGLSPAVADREEEILRLDAELQEQEEDAG
jgi:segregation and condensation protein B